VNPSIRVVIGIPSFKRPQGLARLLDSLAKQRVDFEVRVVVADNDSELQQGIATVGQYQQRGFRFPLEAFAVTERGISQVRNALMQRAFIDYQADFLAMLDDDEWAEEAWLKNLVEVQQQTRADVVGGRVSPEFEVPAPDWAQGLAIYYQQQIRQSGPVNLIYATTNVLLSKSILSQFPGQLFDPFYSLVGGGDVEFFTRLKNLGATFAFAHQAGSHEIFGASRLTRQWARERAFRIGAGDMRIILKNNTSFKRLLTELSKALAASCVAGLQVLLHFTSSHRRMAGQLLFMRQLGKISAVFGKQKPVYRQTHGQ
jgi:glycosyltransferase involved in cell wall biosynthesis